MSRNARAFMTLAICALGALTAGPAAAAPGDLQGVDLSLQAKHDLASPGHDGQVKPRGQNGDLDVLGNTVYVAGGARFHGAQSTPGRVCTDFGGVKVVDVSNPSSPSLRSTIDIADAKTVLSGPVGNARRGQAVKNVSATASAVDAIDHPVANKKVLAIATQRCEQSFFNGARIEFWDVSNPDSPSMMGTFDPETIPNPTPGGSPPNGAWGIFEDVRMFTRNNGPGGSTKVYAVATSPFSIGNSHNASPQGDFRLLDVTNPAAVVQIDTFPKTSISSATDNGCRTFDGGRSAAPTPDGSGAILSWYDGAKPSDTTMANPGTSAAVFRLNLDGLPQYLGGPAPKEFSPNPPTWGFPLGSPGGMTPAGEIEGNAADVQPFTASGDRLMSFMSEEDVDPAITRVTINGPATAAYDGRGCELMFTRKLHQRTGQQLTGQVAYVGRGCPASPLGKSRLRTADPYLQNPNGKLVVFENGGDGFDGCSGGAKIKRAAAAGATGVLLNIGGDFLNLTIPGPDGGIPAVPSVNIQLAAFNKMVGSFVPNRLLAGVAFPPATGGAATYDRTVTTTTVTTSSDTIATATTMAVNSLGSALPAGTVLQFPVGASGVAQVITRADAAMGATSLSIDPPTFVPTTPATIASGTAGAVTNVRVLPLGLTVTGATNAGPIEITTSTVHGLRTGDRVSITDVGGNTAANGNFAVTVTSSTKFTLDGSSGNGAYQTNTGTARQCRPSDPNCSPTDHVRTDISRFRSEANAGDRQARVRSIGAAGRFPVTAGQAYRVSSLIEIASRVDGTFKAAVTWHDAGGTELSRSEFGSLSAVQARSLSTGTVTAPAGATHGAVNFEWTGASAEGVAYVDGIALTPDGLSVTLKDNQGQWGAQRIIDFSQNPPALAGTYRSPRSQVWPPPNDGVYSPRLARMAAPDLALTTWMADGLRVLDVKNPSSPREIGSYVPPDVDDPSDQAGAGITNLRDSENPNLLRGQSWPDRASVTGVGFIPRESNTGTVVISDINAGLYVLNAVIRREGQPSNPPDNPPPPPGQDPPAPTDVLAPVVPGQASPLVARDTTPPTGRMLFTSRTVRRADLFDRNGVAVPVRIGEAGTAQVDMYANNGARLPTLRVGAAQTRRLTLLARGRATKRTPGRVTVRVRPTRTGRSFLRRNRRARVVMVVTLRDTAGNPRRLPRRTATVR